MNYSRFINELSAARVASPLRKLTEIQQAGGPDMISFGTGAPNAVCFPFKNITVDTNYGSINLDGAKLTQALQYGPSNGVPEFRAWLLQLQKRLHPSTYYTGEREQQLDLLVTPGSQDALCKIFDMTMTVGDAIYIEQPTYPGTLAGLRPYQPRFIALRTDANGLDPDSLRQRIAENQSARVLYVQPNCSNPTGVSMTVDRRKQLIELANTHDLLVIEDDPYYQLRFDGQPPPSLLQLDSQGRVLRLDSFSKVVSSGLRLGTVTGPTALMERLALHMQVSSLHASSLSQVIMSELVHKLGHDGFLEHSKRVAAFYASQCRLMCAAAERHLTGLADWHTPDGGMFLWLRLKHVPDSRAMIETKAIAQKVDKGFPFPIVLAPGNHFFFDDEQPTPFMRASFSNVTEQQMDEGFRRLAQLLREEQKERAA